MQRRWLWIGAGVLLLGAGHWVWNSRPVRLKDRLFARNLAEVEPGLYRSGQIDSGLIEGVLRDHGVDVVIDLQGEEQSEDQDGERRAIAELGLAHERFPMPGTGMGDVEAYANAVASIHSSLAAGDTVLVHCAAGSRRTGGVLAAYELLVRGDEARARDELSRFIMGDDPERLLTYLNTNLPAIAVRLREMGIAVVPLPEYSLADSR